jgi:hypothetical protein
MMKSMRNGDVTAVRRRGDLVLDGGLLDGPIDENEQAHTDPEQPSQPSPLARTAPFEADDQASADGTIKPLGCPLSIPTCPAT